LVDTLVELETVVDKFDKYGDPKANAKPVVDITKVPWQRDEVAAVPAPPALPVEVVRSEPLKWPDKGANLVWLVMNVPFSTGLAVLAAFVAVFFAGVGLAPWPPLQSFMHLLHIGGDTQPAEANPTRPSLPVGGVTGEQLQPCLKFQDFGKFTNGCSQPIALRWCYGIDPDEPRSQGWSHPENTCKREAIHVVEKTMPGALLVDGTKDVPRSPGGTSAGIKLVDGYAYPK
jgi:hypothetical protein